MKRKGYFFTNTAYEKIMKYVNNDKKLLFETLDDDDLPYDVENVEKDWDNIYFTKNDLNYRDEHGYGQEKETLYHIPELKKFVRQNNHSGLYYPVIFGEWRSLLY